MGGVSRIIQGCLLIVFWMSSLIFASSLNAQPIPSPVPSSSSSSSPPVEITADSLEFDQLREVYVAKGSVEVVQESVRLTADQVTLHKLSGQLIATGHVYLKDEISDLWTEQLEININTEAGVITRGEIFLRERNSFVTGRKIQRFSEAHYRIKEGSFTNCDAKEGEIPAWRFTFRDLDFDWNESLYGEQVWFNINDIPVFPFPTFSYPLGGKRKSGFLIPTVGLDNVFGFRYRQEFFWAIDPSQDLTIAPLVLTKRGAGGELQYRYALSRQARGEWLMNGIYDTEPDQRRFRAEFKGAHIHQVNRDLSLRMQVNYATDRFFLRDFSNSGVVRALPSQESSVILNHRLNHGSLFFMAQYIQPLLLEIEGEALQNTDTPQRVPELGHRFLNYQLWDSPFVVGMETTGVHFWREKDFQWSRLDLLPSITTEGLHLGHVVGIKPSFKPRGIGYTRGAEIEDPLFRTTYWGAMEGSSSVSRSFRIGDSTRLRHSLEPRVIYEYVPDTNPDRYEQVDGVDDLIAKNLVTYSLSTRLKEQSDQGQSTTWLDLFVAQSWHVDEIPDLATRFSNIWIRAKMNKPISFSPLFSAFQVSVDSFVDPTKGELAQINTDARIQTSNIWYFEIGQRFARSGVQTRRGDIWNPISFNEVLTPQDKIEFVTATTALRFPLGVTAGARVYHDFLTGETSELDVVGVYQNPCKCFTLGLYYIQFPDRQQFNVLVNLTGLGGTQGLGAQLMQSILGPIMAGERGLPWGSP